MRLRFNLPAIGLAAVIALAGLTAAPSSVAATDPSPTPTPTASEAPSPTATPDPSPTPSAEPTPVPQPDPTPTPDPATSSTPAPSSTPDPLAVAPAPTTTAPTRAELIRADYLRAAKVAIRQRHDRYVSGGTGPNAFDCSGLVRYVYRQVGISKRLGGGHSARAMLAWARKHDKTRRRNPQIGDVVVWGNGRHVGIYLGDGKAISALNPRQDIRITRIGALSDPFTTFIRTRP